MKTKRSSALFRESCRYIPGGVNSPVRAFKSVGGNPFFIKRGKGSKIYDVDGNEYVDYVCSWGPLILGHGHPEIVKAIMTASKNGTSFGIPTENELKLAKLIVSAYKAVDMVRLVNSGTEAGMSAIRLARGFTGRDKIIKFNGCYHGHSDSLLVKAGSGGATFGVPDSLGVPRDIARNTLTAEYNDIDEVNEMFMDNPNSIAGVIVEPIAGNMGLVLPKKGFLEGLKELCARYNSLLIFDEVITGFRVAYGGASEVYGIRPDIAIFGKIIGGGLPIGAYGAKKEIMDCISPVGKVYQAGTLSGNPIAVSAGIKMLELLKEKKIYKDIEQKCATIVNALKDNCAKEKIDARINHIGSMFCVFFTKEDVVNYETAKTSNVKLYAEYFHAMLKNGIYIAPSQYETAFISHAHTHSDIDRTIASAKRALMKL